MAWRTSADYSNGLRHFLLVVSTLYWLVAVLIGGFVLCTASCLDGVQLLPHLSYQTYGLVAGILGIIGAIFVVIDWGWPSLKQKGIGGEILKLVNGIIAVFILVWAVFGLLGLLDAPIECCRGWMWALVISLFVKLILIVSGFVQFVQVNTGLENGYESVGTRMTSNAKPSSTSVYANVLRQRNVNK